MLFLAVLFEEEGYLGVKLVRVISQAEIVKVSVL